MRDLNRPRGGEALRGLYQAREGGSEAEGIVAFTLGAYLSPSHRPGAFLRV